MRLHWTYDSAFGLPIPGKTLTYLREYKKSPPISGAGAHEAEEDEEIWFVQPYKRKTDRGSYTVFKPLRKESEGELNFSQNFTAEKGEATDSG